MRLVNQELRNVAVRDVQSHPDNPNVGDVGAIFESIEQNGFFGAIVVQRSTNYVLVGNHRLQAAIEAGASHVPAFVIDVDDNQAKKIMLVDNRSARMGEDDDAKLAELLQGLMVDDPTLAGTGYTPVDLEALLDSMGASSQFTDLDATDESVTYGQVELIIRVMRDNVTPEMHARAQALASDMGGRFLVKGARTATDPVT